LSSLFLKVAYVGAVTISEGKLLVIVLQKKYFRTS